MLSNTKRTNSLLEEFDGSVGKKRARRANDDDDDDDHSSSSGNQPLHGVVACLTGLTHDKKIHFHDLIESLGGKYTREFDLDKNTHLIAETAQGAKYELANSCPRIHIVRPSWLLSCSQEGNHVEESLHSLSMKKRPPTPSIISQIDSLLDESKALSSIFEFHQFYFLGFEDDPKLKSKLSQIIRRGKGTIYWEMNEAITIMIIHNTCDYSLRKAAKIVTDNHFNMPPAVSPLWVIESYKKKFPALPSQFPPIEISGTSSGKITKRVISKPSLSRTNSTSSIFRGCLFSLVRIAPPPWALDFDSKEQEALIKAQGGQMLSLRLIDAMRVDARNGGQRRKCHVVCWGGHPQLELNPILSQLQRYDLCDIIMTTPVWIQTCIHAQKRIRPDITPLALMPQPWPLRKLESTTGISVTLSGFSGTEKLALSKFVVLLGGTISDNMNKTNTHLIVCQEKASKLKVEKAAQWGMHVVTLDWLHHIVEHGFSGVQKEKGGCESHFLFKGTGN